MSKSKSKNKYKCKRKQEVRNSDKNAMQKWISKCDSKGTEIMLSIESKEQLEIKAASNIKLKFNSDTQTAKSVPTFRTSIFWEKSNYWDKHSLETGAESKSDIWEFNTYSLCSVQVFSERSLITETNTAWKQGQSLSLISESLIPIASVLRFAKTEVQIVWYLSEHLIMVTAEAYYHSFASGKHLYWTRHYYWCGYVHTSLLRIYCVASRKGANQSNLQTHTIG